MLHKLHRRWGGAREGRLWARLHPGRPVAVPAE
jgi:hypothetical protein